MEQSITFCLSDRYSDSADIHDALYTYNLSKTKAKRIDVHAERYQEQFALLACDENGDKHGGISFHWKNDPRHIFVDFFSESTSLHRSFPRKKPLKGPWAVLRCAWAFLIFTLIWLDSREPT